MTDCNLRGLMVMSDLQACTTTNISSTTLAGGDHDQYFNLFELPCECIQNIRFYAGSDVYKVFLFDEEGTTNIFLGTTNMCIFANSSIPQPSEPYYNLSGAKKFILKIPNCRVPLPLAYESLTLKSNYAVEAAAKTRIPYFASIEFRSDQPFMYLAKDDPTSVKLNFKDAYTYEIFKE